ncbi:MAG: TonB-dependent receptor [Hyphomonadaceae bacterium]|nr:TonB-dependent receptor [Hyphomonadaceae bacterium]
MANDLLKKNLLASTLLAGMAGGFWAGAATAQDAPDDDDSVTVIEEVDETDEARQEKVVVTGSRIARDEFSSASPLQVIDGEVSRDLGLIDASDLLGQTTVVQGQQTTTGLSTSAGVTTINGPGSATASLRGLDPGRTLVLINGRRLAPAGVRGTPSAPDLNLIPGSLIDRVDVLLDGASSVYGSDAVAGVVNYILRTDIDGLQLDAFITDPEMDGDGGQQQVYSAAFGLSNDRGYMTFAAEYARIQSFTGRQFGSFYEPYADGCRTGYQQGLSGQLYENCGLSFGQGAVTGTSNGFLGYELGAQEAGLPAGFVRLNPFGEPELLNPDNRQGQLLLNYPEFLDANLSPNFQRATLYTAGEYDLGLYGNMTAYYEGSHAIRETVNNSSGQGNVPLTADYVLNGFQENATLYFSSRFETKTEVAQTRLIGGLKGDLPFMDDFGPLQNWGYDVYASYSRSNGDDAIIGIPFFPSLEQTLTNTVINPTTGEAECTSRGLPTTAQNTECRPLNFFEPNFIFGGRFADPEDNAYFFPARTTNTVVEQTVFSGFASGELYELPAGALSAVVGFEYREDIIDTTTDAGTAQGLFQGFSADPGANGSRNLQEVFGEIEVPVLADMPFADELTVNLAARYTSENNFGEESTYRVQAQYAPVDWFTLRSTYGTSFRAPNVGEQFGGRAVSFSNPADPCRTPGVAVPQGDYDNDPTTPETREYQPNLDPRDADLIDRCLNGGGPFGIPGTDPFSLGIVGLGGSSPVFLGAPTQVATGSNPELQAETSTAFSGGFVFEQPWFDQFDLRASATYYEIEIEDEVASLAASQIVGACYDSPGLTDPQCQFITRAPRVAGDERSGEIVFVEALNQNLDQRTNRGIDYNLEFDMDFNIPQLEDAIEYSLIARATQTLEQIELQAVVGGFDVDNDLREYGNPEWRLNLTNIASWQDWSFLFQSRFIGNMIENNDDPLDPQTFGLYACVIAGDQPCNQFDALDHYWVHDMSLRYSTGDWTLRGGVSNVFNDQPPLTDNNQLSNIAGIGYDLGGRTFFMNVTKTF